MDRQIHPFSSQREALPVSLYLELAIAHPTGEEEQMILLRAMGYVQTIAILYI